MGQLSQAFPPLGARPLIDGESVVGMNFSATVGKLEEAQGRDRSLGFHVLSEGGGGNAAAQSLRGGGEGGENTGADILKLPSISRPSSSSTTVREDRRKNVQANGKSIREKRPSSAGMDVENPEEHESTFAKTLESRKKGAWNEQSEVSLDATPTAMSSSTNREASVSSRKKSDKKTKRAKGRRR